MPKINFTKSHGLGNDFIIIDNYDGRLDFTAGMVRSICDRHFGVGADGLIIAGRSETADCFMDFRNADGSIAGMCGNGIRALAKHIFDNGQSGGEATIDTRAGVKMVGLTSGGGIKVDMGKPVLDADLIPVNTANADFIDRTITVAGVDLKATCVSMGNPHCVIFVDELNSCRLEDFGPKIETLDIFPERTNVEFVQVMDWEKLTVRVWERGVGETLACGTGACAGLVAAHVNDLAARKSIISLPGGDLSVDWRDDDHVILAGPVKKVFTGQIDM